jgi:hypothetical protein
MQILRGNPRLGRCADPCGVVIEGNDGGAAGLKCLAGGEA